MTKRLLIKYLSGNAKDSEEQAVLEWVSRCDDNLKYFVSLKSLWVFQNMPNSQADASEIEDMRKLTSSYINNSKGKPKIFRYLPYAAASVIIILLGLNLFYLGNKIQIKGEPKQERVLLSSIPAEYKHVLYTNNGVKGYVKLPDGSVVWLNSASRIEYPDKFMGATREINISGEAFFDVVSNPNKPMIVSTNKNFKVEVLGTKFNIRSYENDTEAQTTLFSGLIKLTRKLPSSGREVTTMLHPKESFVLKDYMAPVLITQSDTSKQVAWKEGKLLFDSTPMLEVIKKLERWHGTEFIVKDREVLDYKITANFRSESIVQIMEMIQFCSLINYTVVGNQVTISKRQSV
jgi:transmembrane sensor